MHNIVGGREVRVFSRRSFVRSVITRVKGIGGGQVPLRRFMSRGYDTSTFHGVCHGCRQREGRLGGVSFSSVLMLYCRLFHSEPSMLTR